MTSLKYLQEWHAILFCSLVYFSWSRKESKRLVGCTLYLCEFIAEATFAAEKNPYVQLNDISNEVPREMFINKEKVQLSNIIGEGIETIIA